MSDLDENIITPSLERRTRIRQTSLIQRRQALSVELQNYFQTKDQQLPIFDNEMEEDMSTTNIEEEQPMPSPSTIIPTPTPDSASVEQPPVSPVVRLEEPAERPASTNRLLLTSQSALRIIQSNPLFKLNRQLHQQSRAKKQQQAKQQQQQQQQEQETIHKQSKSGKDIKPTTLERILRSPENPLAPNAMIFKQIFKYVGVQPKDPREYYLDYSNLHHATFDAESSDEIEYIEEPVDASRTDHNTPQVKCATVSKLIELLTTKEKKDDKFTYAFLLTYRTFLTPHKLLEELSSRYNTPPPKKSISRVEFAKFEIEVLKLIREQVNEFLVQWIESHFTDFANDSHLVSKVREFIDVMHQTKSEQLAASLKETLDKQIVIHQQKEEEDIRKMQAATLEVNEMSYHCDILLTFTPEELAHQITHLEYNLFVKIQQSELVNKSWSKSDRTTLAPNVCHMINWFNLFSNFVASRVLLEPNLQNRQIILEILIKLAYELMKLNNFNGVFEVCSALNSCPIHRLSQTWENITPSVRKMLNEMTELISSNNNFARLRKTVNVTKPPCIPYIGIYLTDLTFIEDGNQDIINGKINFIKRRKLAGVISELKIFQDTPYDIQRDDTIQNFLREVKAQLSNDEMYPRSLILEPRKQ